MRRLWFIRFLVLLPWFSLAIGSLCACGELIAAGSAPHGVAATVHPLATEAALCAMRQGGNAIDAAVAAGLTLGVVDGHNSGIGGGCFMLIRLADGSVVALDGRETAPAKATPDMYVREGKPDLHLSQQGALAPGVPGSVAVYAHAVRRYGKLTLKDHLLAAAQIAEQGFLVTRTYAQRLAAEVDGLRAFPETRAIFLRPDGSPFSVGETLVQADLGRTYRAMAEEGVDWFYRGPFAQRTESWMKTHQGILTGLDFAQYEMKQRSPTRTIYRGYDIIGFPPPGSGGVHVAQILNILEHFDLKKYGPDSADFVHLVAEAMKLAFADRAHWLGDPDFVAVPQGLISKSYAAVLAKTIRLDRAEPVPQHGWPDGVAEDVSGKHTTHFSTADEAGNWVACTATVNLSFGSKVVVPGTGVLLNNQMDDFSVQAGVPNAFGLLGGEANAIAPGKRPLSSMSPTFVCQGGQPVLAVGAAGGPTIISQVLLAILHVVDFGQPVANALAQPRFHHQWKPDALQIEARLAERIGPELERRGHRLKVVASLGVAQAVARELGRGQLTGAADPRGEGLASGAPPQTKRVPVE